MLILQTALNHRAGTLYRELVSGRLSRDDVLLFGYEKMVISNEEVDDQLDSVMDQSDANNGEEIVDPLEDVITEMGDYLYR